MRWGMEILAPSSIFPNSYCFLDKSKSAATWTAAENKAFENALALFDDDTPNRWERVAEMVPGKTIWDVIKQYKELEDDVSSIEAGLIPVPGYSTSSPPFTLEWGSGHRFEDRFNQSYVAGGIKKSSSATTTRPCEQERKKGIPWTEEEHKLFLLGLKKYGKGDWRNISRNFVITRTPTQVASHAQKYFIRQLSGGKDKRRASIHDITTINLPENQVPSTENKKPPSPGHSFHTGNERNMRFSSAGHGNMFMSKPYNLTSLGHPRGAILEPYLGSQNMVFQMQSGTHYPSA